MRRTSNSSPLEESDRPLRAAEFFAGIGLMRWALAGSRIETVWANDIDDAKAEAYIANFGARELVVGDIRDIGADSVPTADLATASFPCTDLSLAGNRKGLGAEAAPKGTTWESSMFWEFSRLLREMGPRRPRIVLCENVLGFASSRDGADLRRAISELNALGYSCDVLAINASHFVPQSRPRMFIVGTTIPIRGIPQVGASDARPPWVIRFIDRNADLAMHAVELPPLPAGPLSLAAYVEELPDDDPEWWDVERTAQFEDSLSPIQRERLNSLRSTRHKTWHTAYRRTRRGRAVWEIRADAIAGCLRTARGGSSRQAVVEAGYGGFRVRWMTPREYARLMGAADYRLPTRRNQALFGFGDAVCVPVIRWLCAHYVLPLAGASSQLPLPVAA